MLGAVIGSFAGALVIRGPQGRSLGGRSSCDGCRRALRWYELVPLLSFVAQQGRCRSCEARIERVQPAAEVLCALVGGAAFYRDPAGAGLWGACFGWLLVALALLDLREFWLPDAGTAALALVGIASGLAGEGPSLTDRTIGGAAGFVSLAAIAWSYRAIRGREGLGGGDPKLLGAVGLWTGWQTLPAVLVSASLAGLAAALAMVLVGREVTATTRLPLGTLIALAAFPVWLFSR